MNKNENSSEKVSAPETRRHGIKQFYFNYRIGEPINNGAFRFFNRSRKITGYDFRGAAIRLREVLSRRWVLPITLEIRSAYRLDESGAVEINPDLIPEINALYPFGKYDN